MSEAANALAEFHEFYGRDDPILGLRLRMRLITEEYEELLEETRADWTEGMEYDLRKLYKELADLVYVAYGMDLHLGGHLDRVFREVHKSNMTKLWACDACEGIGRLPVAGPTGDLHYWDCAYCAGEGKVVRRREDGKVLKPPTYQPPDLSFVEEPQDG